MRIDNCDIFWHWEIFYQQIKSKQDKYVCPGGNNSIAVENIMITPKYNMMTEMATDTF